MGTDSELAQAIQYVLSRYGKAVVVFAGRKNEPSTKDFAHFQRNGFRVGLLFCFIPDMTLVVY